MEELKEKHELTTFQKDTNYSKSGMKFNHRRKAKRAFVKEIPLKRNKFC